MTIIKTKYSFLIIFLLVSTSFSQFKKSQPESRLSPISKIYRGFEKSTEWYDVPILAAYFLRNTINPQNLGDKIYADPMDTERKFANQFNGGSSSLGSMDKDLIPNTIFFSRIAINFGLDLFTDVEISDKSYQKIFTFNKSLLYTYIFTEYVKSLVKRTRPDGSDDRSFFSGHTSTTFAAATFLYKELHDAYNNWNYLNDKPILHTAAETLSFGVLYGWAGYVGYSRIHDRRHYISDVIVGALVGTAISYFVYEGYFGERDSILNNFSLRTLGKDLAIDFRLNLL